MSYTDFDTETDDLDEEAQAQAEADEKRKRAESRLQDTANKARAERDEAKRELAFIKAGIDTDSKLGALIMRGYDGELTVDAIKAYASELGAVQAPEEGTQVETPEISAEEQAATDERSTLAAGAATGPLEEPPKTPDAAHAEAMAAGYSNDDAMVMAIRALAENKANWHEQRAL